jgi:hypothetical protein
MGKKAHCQSLVSLTLAQDEVPVPVSLRLSQGRGRKPVPDEEPGEAEKALAGLSWRRIAWRQGTKGALAAGAQVVSGNTI